MKETLRTVVVKEDLAVTLTLLPIALFSISPKVQTGLTVRKAKVC